MRSIRFSFNELNLSDIYSAYFRGNLTLNPRLLNAPRSVY